MPRAFLIKSKKERKKAEGGDENENKNLEQVDSLQDSLEARMATSDGPSQVSEPQSTSDVRSEAENVVKTQTEEKPAVSEDNQHNPIPRGKTIAKKALKEVQIYEAPKCKKPRKRAPKRSSIYYYNDESDEASDESERQEGSCVPGQRGHSRNNIPNVHNYHSSSSAVNCKDSSEAERTNSEGYCFARQPQQSRCQENSTQFEYDKTVGQQVPREENKPQLPRIVDDKENQINEGLHNVKIVEYHSINNNIEIVYPDIPRPKENPVPENCNAEKFYHVQSSPTVPSAPASRTQDGEAPQRAVSAPNPVPSPAPNTAPQQPVIHYVPVFAVQGPNGVYYEPVPGAPHVVQNGPPAPYGSPQPGHPQPAQQPPEQAVAAPPLPPHSAPQQLPPHSVPQQLPPHQLMQPVQSHQVPPQQVPQPQPQPLQQGTAMHRQRLPSQPGTPPYPVPQPYNPPTSIHSAGVVYSQQPQAMPYPTESPSYAKPVQVAPGLPYPPNTQVAMATKAYPVLATVQTPAPTPVPQPYAVPPQSGHAAMQYPLYPPSSQSTATPQLYPAQEYPPVTQSQVLQHYPRMPTQPHPRQPLQGAVTGQPYPLQPQQGAPAAQMYQPSQVSPPYPHSAPVVVMQQLYPANKTSPVPAASYPAPARGQFAPPGNPPHTSQASYYPPKTITVPSQPHPSVRPVPLPAQVYPENRNGIPPPQYMPRESEPKFVYAPPPVNFHQSPVYRVPEQSKSAEAAPTLANNSHDKTVTGSRRRKASVPHRGMRDIPTPPDSYAEQPSPQGGLEKSECHNSPLNKSSCIITPPGSPQDEDQNGQVETYTVVVHDRGIQTRLPEMEPRWCPTKRLWKMEPKRLPPPAQQQQQQPQPLVESGKGLKVEVLPQNGSLSPVEYSPTQKENMYIPTGHSMNTQRPHGMRRGRGRKSSSRYHCKFCSKGFQWHSHLTSHERTHTGEKPYQCSECSRAFTRADGLQCHMIVHNKKKPFKCQYCGKGFSDNTLLEKHVYSHTGVKPFKCEYCGRAFTDSQSIEKHLLVHTGTKPYKCQYCVRSFNDSQMLVRHIRSHTGEKPYKCRHCPMAFSKQSALVIHTRVHTGEKPYKCPNCPKSFSISGNLQRHILIHTGERPYKCSKCPKAFNNPSHLSRHISKLHAPKALEKNNCVAVPMETNTIKVETTS